MLFKLITTTLPIIMNNDNDLSPSPRACSFILFWRHNPFVSVYFFKRSQPTQHSNPTRLI